MNPLRLLRAEYIWQPLQLFRRLDRTLRPTAPMRVELPWGLEIDVDPQESIGRSILALNVVDLTVLEAIWRLLDPGEVAVDAGANIGFMTAAMARRVGGEGCVYAFEPMPELLDPLRRSCSGWQEQTGAKIAVRALALSRTQGTADLEIPETFCENRGLCRLLAGSATPANAGQRVIKVETTTLDREFLSGPGIDLVKLDIEGHEAAAIEGASGLLEKKGVRDVIFEEHQPFPARSHAMLEERGLTLFRLGRGSLGPRLLPSRAVPRWDPDPANFLATREPERVRARFAQGGWRVLRGSKGRNQ